MVKDNQIQDEPRQRNRKHTKRGASPLFIFAVIAVTAVVGYIAGTRSNEIVAFIGPVFGLKSVSGDLDLSNVQATYRALKAN